MIPIGLQPVSGVGSTLEGREEKRTKTRAKVVVSYWRECKAEIGDGNSDHGAKLPRLRSGACQPGRAFSNSDTATVCPQYVELVNALRPLIGWVEG
jgi:hypothetical protein